MTTASDVEPTYLFGPRDRRVLLLGLRAPQLALITMAALSLLLGLISQSSYGGWVGVLVALATVSAAFVPVQGRPLVDWLRPLANFIYGRVTGQGSYLGGPWAVHAPTQSNRDLALPGIGGRGRAPAFDAGPGGVAAITPGGGGGGVPQGATAAGPPAGPSPPPE